MTMLPATLSPLRASLSQLRQPQVQAQAALLSSQRQDRAAARGAETKGQVRDLCLGAVAHGSERRGLWELCRNKPRLQSRMSPRLKAQEEGWGEAPGGLDEGRQGPTQGPVGPAKQGSWALWTGLSPLEAEVSQGT